MDLFCGGDFTSISTSKPDNAHRKFTSVEWMANTETVPTFLTTGKSLFVLQCPFIDEYILGLHNKIKSKPVEFPEE